MPTDTRERMTIFAKAYGIKVRCYWEHTGQHVGAWINTTEPIVNSLKTWWEQSGNTLGTKGKWKIPPAPPILKEKLKPLECMMHLLISACDIYFHICWSLFFYSTNSPFYKHGCILWALIKLYSFKLEF